MSCSNREGVTGTLDCSHTCHENQPNAGVCPRAAAQMRYFDFVVGLKTMSHYSKIIQEIMVFGKSTMICVS